jgi:hypothetical protein
MASHTDQSRYGQQSSAGQQSLPAPSNTGSRQSTVSRSILPAIGTFRARVGDHTGPILYETSVHGNLDVVVTNVDDTDRRQGFRIWSVLDNPPAAPVFSFECRVPSNTWFECEANDGFVPYAIRDQNQRTNLTYGATHDPQQSTQAQLPTPEQSPPPTTNGA